MLNIATLTKEAVRESTLIGTVLSHLHGPGEAKLLEKLAIGEHPIVSFGKHTEGTLTFGHEITHDTIAHARIRVSPKGATPDYHHFKRIAAQDGTVTTAGHGLSASAWIKTDAKGEPILENGKTVLRLCYPGFPPGASMAQTTAMLSSIMHEFPQAREVGPFLDKVMCAGEEMKLPKFDHVMSSSWSMGAANALASKLYFHHRKIPSTTILGDAWQASSAVQNIAVNSNILRPLFNNSRAEVLRYEQSQLQGIMTEDVISIYPALKDSGGNWKRSSLTAPEASSLMKLLMPSDTPIGHVVHIDAANMPLIGRLPILGDTHYRPNIIAHLAEHDTGILHDITPAIAQPTGRSVA